MNDEAIVSANENLDRLAESLHQKLTFTAPEQQREVIREYLATALAGGARAERSGPNACKGPQSRAAFYSERGCRCPTCSETRARFPEARNAGVDLQVCWVCKSEEHKDALTHMVGIGYACRDKAACRERRDDDDVKLRRLENREATPNAVDDDDVIDAARELHDAFLRIDGTTRATMMNRPWARLHNAFGIYDKRITTAATDTTSKDCICPHDAFGIQIFKRCPVHGESPNAKVLSGAEADAAVAATDVPQCIKCKLPLVVPPGYVLATVCNCKPDRVSPTTSGDPTGSEGQSKPLSEAPQLKAEHGTVGDVGGRTVEDQAHTDQIVAGEQTRKENRQARCYVPARERERPLKACSEGRVGCIVQHEPAKPDDANRLADAKLADEIIARLNALIANADVRTDVGLLIGSVIPCSRATQEHPSIQVSGENRLGFLGLLNGIIGVLPGGPHEGWGYISAVSDEHMLVRFERTDVHDSERPGFKRGRCAPPNTCLACDRRGYHLEPITMEEMLAKDPYAKAMLASAEFREAVAAAATNVAEKQMRACLLGQGAAFEADMVGALDSFFEPGKIWPHGKLGRVYIESLLNQAREHHRRETIEACARECEAVIETNENAEGLKLWPVRDCVTRVRALLFARKPAAIEGEAEVHSNCIENENHTVADARVPSPAADFDHDAVLSDMAEEDAALAAFVPIMRLKLFKNRHKSSWKRDPAHYLLARVCEELAEVVGSMQPHTNATRAFDQAMTDLTRAAQSLRTFGPVLKCLGGARPIAFEAADVANMVMMVADVMGGLAPGLFPKEPGPT